MFYINCILPEQSRTIRALAHRSNGTWSADGTGQWAVAGPALADGHYRLDAKQTGTPGGDKSKVFWVKCGKCASPVAGRGARTFFPVTSP